MLKKPYIRQETLIKLQNANKKLQKQGYRLIIWDAWRSKETQNALWEAYPNGKYLIPPHKISRHRRGTSLDVSLADKKGNPIEMPSDFDHFTKKADWNFEDVSPKAAQNAQTLKIAMLTSGFTTVPDEWWHYDLHNWPEFPPLDP